MYFHPFVLPFCIGVLILFAILIIKYTRWISQLSKDQVKLFWRKLFTWRIFVAIWECFRECLLHFRIYKHNIMLGIMHSSIAFGWFLLIVVGKIESWFYMDSFFGRPWMGIFFRYFAIEPRHFKGAGLLTNTMDFLLLVVLTGIFLAFIKRLYSKIFGMKKTSKHVIFDKFALYSLWAIFPLRFLSESFTAAYAYNGGFMTQFVGNMIDPFFASSVAIVFWWLYSIALLVFFVSMPFSRYMHILTEVFLIFFRNLGIKEEVKITGYTKFELSACSRCGICIDGCPINSELNITNIQSVYFLRDIRYKKLTDQVADNCLMCNRCVNDCPVQIETTQIRRQQRDKGALDTFNNYPYINNIQPFNSIGRVIYFSGCMSHLTPNIQRSMLKIFEAANQKYWYMDEDRTICCGRPLLQQGFSNQAADLIQKNMELIKKSGARMLITSCPICYQSFKQEYNLNIEIMHHTEYIERLIKKNRIKVRHQDIDVVYHDPCELGRGAGIYKAPRKILETIANLKKAEYEKQHSICCGYNLGNTVLELEQQMKIRNASMKNLMDTQAEVLCTACPMCKKAFTHATKQRVQDIAEIVAENLI